MRIFKILTIMIFSFTLFNSLAFTQYNADEKALIEACKNGNLEAAKKLIRTGTDVNIVDEKKFSALIYAVKSGNLDLVKELVKFGADVTYYGGGQIDAAFFALDSGRNDIIEYLLSKGANPTDFLFYSIYKNDINRVKGFLKKGAKANYYLTYASKKGNIEIIRELIKSGANGFDEALYETVKAGGSPEVVKELVKNGADVNYKEADYAGSDNSPERYYDYLILYAVRSKNINTVKILIEAGADLNVYGEYEHNNPLMVAVENNDAEMVKLLLSSGIDVNEELENKRENILTWCISKNRGYRYSSYKVDIKVIEALLEGGADYNAKNYYGKNALMVAASEGREDIIELFEKYGA